MHFKLSYVVRVAKLLILSDCFFESCATRRSMASVRTRKLGCVTYFAQQQKVS